MNFRRYRILPVIVLFAVLLIQPALSEANVTEFITGKNVTSVTNQTADLEQDVATQYFNYAQRQLAGCGDTCDYPAIITLYDRALAENLTMLKKTDGLQYLYQGKSYVLIQMKNFTGAVATAEAGLAVYPKDPMLWNNRGWALEQLGRTQDALSAYDKAVSFDGNYTNALINQGNLLTEMGKYKEASAAFIRANETDPFNVIAADGLDAAKKAEADSSRTMSIVMGIVLIAAVGLVIWYVKFRKPAEPEEKKKKSKKK